MKIDYDRLRELADKASHGPWEVEEIAEQYVGYPAVTKFYLGSEDMQNIAVGEATDRHYDQAESNFALITLTPDMARELLRLRDRLANLTDRLAILHDEARIYGNPNGADAYDFAIQEIARILNGDTE